MPNSLYHSHHGAQTAQTAQTGDETRGILLVNLGSPDSTAVRDVRVYLRQFLMDKYVIDAPYLVRKLIVECFILPFRPRASAAKYRSIWWADGSPLIVLSRRFQEAFRRYCADNWGMNAERIRLAMRYGNPSIEQELRAFQADGVRELTLVPMYPHYAMSTVTTVVEEAERVAAECGIALRVVPPFYKHPAYIAALADSAKSYLEQGYDHVVMSYHGIPLRHLTKTDCTGEHCLKAHDCCAATWATKSETAAKAHSVCYRHQTQVTTRLFADVLGIPDDKLSLTYQSRIAGDKWMKPYTDATLKKLAEQGVKRCVVLCPAFVADCLETLEEIAEEGKEIFLEHGGEELHVVPCLNDYPAFVRAMSVLIEARTASDTLVETKG
jgi:ferrochelatase